MACSMVVQERGGSVRKTLKKLVRSPLVLRSRVLDWRLRADAEELAIAAIFREEAPFLDDWLRFHHGVGVGHFYLYNNFSTDHFRAVLAPWMARGLVTLHEWPVAVGQLPAYRHCVREYRLQARWIAFIDVDEFLFSPRQADLRPILAGYRDVPGLLVYSPYFGAAGHQARPAEPVPLAFTRRAPLARFTAKTIANPRRVYAIRNVHTFKYWEGESVGTDRQPLRTDAPCLDLLRLNHYWSRSLCDLATKIARGDASTAQRREHDWHFAFEQTLNAEEDRSIIPLARELLGGGTATAPRAGGRPAGA